MYLLRLGHHLWALILAIALMAVSPATAQQAEDGFGPLAQYLPATGQGDVWRYANTGDTFEIENIGDPQAIQYFYLAPADGEEGRRVIETEVSLHPDFDGSAGLLYGLNEARSLYHMLTLGADGMVTMYRRDEAGFRPLIQQTSEAFLPGRVNRLTLHENGDEVRFALNGTELGAIGGDLFGRGAVGLAAVGDVRAFFSHFSASVASDRSDLPRQQPQEGMRRADAPDDMMQVRRVDIVDSQGPAGQMLAYHTLVPEGWDVKGGVKWTNTDGPQGCFTGARLIWGAGTPDEAYGMAFMDPISWGMSSYGPSRYMCLPMDLTDAEAAARAYFDAISGALQVSITDMQRAPDIQPLVDAVGRVWNVSNVPGVRTWADGVVVTARVKTAERENDAAFIVVTKHIENQVDASTVFRDGRTALVLGFFTPVGKLEAGHPGFGVIMNNLRANPQWQQIEAQWWSTKIRSTGAAIQNTAQAESSVGDMMFESWKRREGMRDAGQAKSVNGIWEVQPWQTNSGGTVLLNQNYNHAWELGNGSIVLTNNANFNPMQSLNQTGQAMRPQF